MSIRYIALLMAGWLVAGNVLASNGELLARKSNCTTICHAVEKKLVGPAYKDVASKYREVKDAQAMLEKKVRSGGGGVWGSMPMPAAAKSVSDDDVKTIIAWVLSLK